MHRDLSLPEELPEGFQFTAPDGLTDEQAEQFRAAGAGNRINDPDSKPLPRILREHIFTLFNLLNFSLGLCLLLVGSYRNMLFLFIIVANILIGSLQEYGAMITIS